MIGRRTGWRENSAGILDDDFIDVGALDNLMRLGNVHLIRMNRTVAEDQPVNGTRAKLLGMLEIGRRVFEVVEPVEGQHPVGPVTYQNLNPEPVDVRRLDIEPQHTGAANEALQRRVDQPFLDLAHAFERIVAQITHAGVEVHVSHQFDGTESRTIERLDDGQHHGRRHARRPQALMPITQGRVEYLYALWHIRN